ncbi:MAG: acyltransferase domain-containing protein [Boseongicola sp. SB0675_bin_26]|nr:acyltransferase domain-containing protein [Boseongicola sp. SB0675_bin_26]
MPIMHQMTLQMPVAIVGYSYRMPGGIRTDDDFWHLLSNREIVQEPITDRYGRGYRPIGGYSGPSRFASPWEGLIRDDGEKLFDCGLFGMSQNEMTLTDPQVRMLLTCAWETFEHVGWDLHGLRNSQTGVFIGAQVPAAASWRPMHGAGPFDVTTLSVAMLANRISYHFNLMGPSIAYCTACSASLTALHSAINALACGDCRQALVGSVNYLGTFRLSASFNALGVISPDGKCHSFDADANGYMRAEGAFTFAIKTLETAEKDGDTIYAVVEGTAVNAAGAADGTGGLAQGRYITAPTRHAQAELMREACKRANRSPLDFDYIEAHATGTVVGDRIEGNAISEAFSGFERATPLRLASVKSNVGHMEAAAFHCALLKVLLMMERRTFAPISRNFLVPNPEIDFESCPMQVQTECEPFPDHPVTVGINSFGFGGANGHCVVREYRPKEPRIWSVPLAPEAGFMVPLSARTADALKESARDLRRTLGEREFDLYALAGNLSRRRTHFATRTAFAVRNREALIEALDTFVDDPSPVTTASEESPRLLMVFSGQGTQWAGCGRDLYRADPVFRRVVDAIEVHWREHSDHSLREACFFAPQEELDEVQLAQPVIFMLQCALVEWFKTWGVHPDCVLGHSSGEVAAAYASGALSLADATRLVYHRASLQQRTAGSGRMLAIGLDRPGVESLLETLVVPDRSGNGLSAGVEIACENAPASTVICGNESALQPIMEELDRQNRRFQLLPGNIAFHSSAMDPLRDAALAGLSFLDGCEFNAEVPFVSSVTGAKVERLDAGYWWSNIRRTVRFSAAMETVRRDLQPDVVLEIAPHGALQPTIAQCLEVSDPIPACIPTFMRDSDACQGVLEALGALFRAGVALDFTAQYPRPEPIAHLLPGHPRDERAAMEIMCDDEMFVRQGQYSHGPLVGHKVPSSHMLFEARLSERDFHWMADHRVHHAAIMPAAGYIELILEAFEGAPVHIEVLEFLQPCPIPKVPVRLQTALHPVDNAPDTYTFSISSRPYDVNARSELHCRGKVRRTDANHPMTVPTRLEEIDTNRFAPSIVADDSDFYERLEAVLSETFQYGPHFQTIQRVLMDTATRDSLVDIEMDEALWTSGKAEGYVSCPPLFDGGLQIFLFNLLKWADLFAVPRRAEDVIFLKPPSGPRITCHVTKPEEDWLDVNERGQYSVRLGERSGGSIGFYDGDTGELVAYIGMYTYFTSNPHWNDVLHSKHVVSWQPKFIPDGPELDELLPRGDIGPAELISAIQRPESGMSRSCRVLEIAGDREPDRTALKECLDELNRADAQTEYWLVGDSQERAREQFENFHSNDAALRFECLDLSNPPELDRGLLRASASELFFLHREAAAYSPEDWAVSVRSSGDGFP